MLSNTTGQDNHVILQVEILVKRLCKAFSLPEPTSDLERLKISYIGDPEVGSTSNSASGSSTSANTTENGSSDENDMEYEFDEEDAEEEEEEEDDMHLDLDDEILSKNKEKEEIDSEHVATLERLKANQRQDYLHGTVTGSVQASDRLMKELKDIYRSDTFKKGYNLLSFNGHQ